VDIGYWIDFFIVFSLGVILVQVSHGKFLDTMKLTLNFSPSFLKIIRYIGLFVIIYSCYGVGIDYAVTP
jgi:hypothetical protein